MSIKISLSDNTIHDIPIEFMEISSLFKDDITCHVHTSLNIFNKIKDFGDYYLRLDNKDKKLFENLPKIYDTDLDKKKWCDEFLNVNIDILIELMDVGRTLKIKPLIDLCCFKLSTFINNNDINGIKQLFIDSGYTPEEKKPIIKELKWIV